MNLHGVVQCGSSRKNRKGSSQMNTSLLSGHLPLCSGFALKFNFLDARLRVASEVLISQHLGKVPDFHSSIVQQ